jgi:hypothetical protein
MALLGAGGIFIGVRFLVKRSREKKEKEKKKAQRLEFEIGPITLQ